MRTVRQRGSTAAGTTAYLLFDLLLREDKNGRNKSASIHERTKQVSENEVIREMKITLLLSGCSGTVKNSHHEEQSAQREWSPSGEEEAPD